MRARVEIAVLQALLTGLGQLMASASRRSARFRRQVTRDLVIEVASVDGARQQYVFDGARRTMDAPLRRCHQPEATLRFGTARDALVALLSPRRVGRIVEGMNTGETRIDGNAVLILWFHGMTRVVAPIGASRRPRKPGRLAQRRPETRAPYARRIVSEPAVRELSRDWPVAWAAREKLLQLRAPAEQRLPPG